MLQNQFGFRTSHSTIEQVHRITDVIEKAFEEKNVCSAVFLDVAQAFDKVWHEGLLHKLRCQLPKSFCDFLTSFLSERYFRVKLQDSYSELKPIFAGVPQGSILGPILYLLYTSDIPTSPNYLMATFADDTAILTTNKSAKDSNEALQSALDSINTWTKKWRIKLNHQKSVHVVFTTMQIPADYNLYLMV